MVGSVPVVEVDRTSDVGLRLHYAPTKMREHKEGAMSEPTDEYPMQADEPTQPYEPPQADESTEPIQANPWRTWKGALVVGGVFVLGIIIGGAIAVSGEEDNGGDEATARELELDEQIGELDDQIEMKDRRIGFLEGRIDDLDIDQQRVQELETSLAEAEAELESIREFAEEAEQAQAQAEAESEATGFGGGTHVVGTDIQPGTYRTDGPTGGVPFCYWARLSGLSGELGDIITNGNTEGPTTVQIQESDVAFESQFCRTWQRVE